MTKNKEVKVSKDMRGELNEAQEELINKQDSQYQKPPTLPKGQKLSKKELTPDLCVALIFIYKFYRHNDNAEIGQYYSRKEFFTDILSDKEYNNITKHYHRLKWWGLIEPMPTDPDVIKYKKGYWGITETGIGFVQRELGIPKYALVYNDFPYEHITDENYIMIDNALKEIGIEYSELITE
jgi:hypothetical protein